MAWIRAAVAHARRPSPTSPSAPGVSRQTVSNAVNNPDLLRADTLARVQDAIAELGYSPNRAARNLRTRASHLIGLRFNPAQEGTANAAMDRFVHSLVETSGEAGYHVLLFAGDRRRPGRRVRRPAALDRRRRVRRHRHLPRQPAGGLARRQRRAPFVAFGRPWDNPEATHPWVDVDGAAGAELATDHLLDRGHTRIAWIGWRKDSCIGEDRRAGWTRAHARPRPAHHRPGLPGRGHRRQRPRGERRAARRGPAHGVRLRLRHPRHGRAAHARRARPRAGASDIAVVGFDDSQVAQVVPAGLTSVRQPLEEVAVEVVKALEGLLATPPVTGPGVLLDPDARGARDELRAGRFTG